MVFKQNTSTNKTGVPVYGKGIVFNRYFTKENVHPYDEIEWESRTASIKDSKGGVVFEQTGIETPKDWSQTATNIVAQKYFRGKVGTPERENSMKQLISRVATTMANWGRMDGYFQSAKDAQIFEDELTHILINQMAAFNSPVWFNVGVNSNPQCSACFINSVEDDMRSILHLATTESMLFKGGSGAGCNLSKLRSTQEFLGGSNGKSSGPVSFMKGFDAFAGVVKSGGKTRRAAKMVILNVEHPDVVEFIECKVKEEKKAWALIDAGYDASMNGDAYSSIFFQNANNSVRVNDEFMQAVLEDSEWVTKEVTTGNDSLKYRAKDVFRKMAEAAWLCGDPGIQYDTIINKWHTAKNTDRIHASNPCSEYMFINDSACNLASLNLMKFRKRVDGKMEFDPEAFKKATAVIITAQEIAVSNSSYPTPAIEENSYDYRPLGIGFANLGALLMSRGLPYDSEAGRNMAGAIMSLLSGEAYYQSAKIAEKIGAFAGYKKNEVPTLEVMHMHRKASYDMKPEGVPSDLLFEARKCWDNVVDHGSKHGLRNAQISVLAPTGTIAFLMDCDTTGVEPDIALVKYKWLVGGGMIKIVNNTVTEALDRLGYSALEINEIMIYIDANDTIEGAPHIKEADLPVFDCAFKAKNGERTIHYLGHLRMMAAVQPFVSGAISKTVNMPSDATVLDVEEVYMEGWKMGLKAIAIYRDGSKRQQALTTSNKDDDSKNKVEEGKTEKTPEATPAVQTVKVTTADYSARRRRMPDERRSLTHRFSIGPHKGYITVGLYDDGTPGELFVTMAKEGSVISGLMDAFATSVSMALQYGVPLPVLVNKFAHMRFEPSGFTNNPNIRMAKSIVDYIFRWMALKFLSRDEQVKVGVNFELAENQMSVGTSPSKAEEQELEDEEIVPEVAKQTDLFKSAVNKTVESAVKVVEEKEGSAHTMTFDNSSDAPACDTCGSIMVRNASCYKCLNCGSTSGCS
ncbi:ribonucleoside-diphosphate reductase, adenosylcobalamin-dependent [Candidatus Uhrbacteria bacterium CG_4_9_14_3_um_filter_41_35]|uniref:Vitamin B12-dependent ribonucleotide reductase n=1 Tax=Candidatus Uhrbacteria bacterium CG_4_9_14_3_um_filter_41_35 TaxID=1975034 RepID=A0A2M7XFP9_9BACT|nr:MAG: ribonucleoside-diphosphate reductase, adenosylcobalamin-dependent [Candidatus Uhrbacteria bacterium CG11_big_fil_rev_8_21_14_0_20_41_9]PJA46720.1 MAG: ribonucleoside-diphosphate reductase, adenosylcobalamin-dependent [Candidatus Uhrbacteria bacterium CG_4_9_14_3_um_filter_41_35]